MLPGSEMRGRVVESVCSYFLLVSLVSATLNPQWGHLEARFPGGQRGISPLEYEPAGQAVSKRQAPPSKFLNDNTRKFLVNGSAIPNVNFDVGESFAGLLPIGDANDTTNQLYFWFHPSPNPAADKEILIWLTGGPGCSSAGESLQANGPFLWQPGVHAPVRNKWGWNRLTNAVWIDQPVGTGFSVGTPTARNEFDVARQFAGFWRNFVDTFSLQGYKVYVTGSSYSGMYCPYVANELLQNQVDVKGMMIFDAAYSKDSLAQDIPMGAFVDYWDKVFLFNETFKNSILAAADSCGYTDYLAKYLVFPPSERQPADLPGQFSNGTYIRQECGLINNVFVGALDINPCFSPYSIFNKCPRKLDPLGFSDGSFFLPDSFGPVYLNRPDVKAAINAPDKEWVFCTSDPPVFVNNIDETVLSGPGSQPVLPAVIEKTQNVILGHGLQDFVLVAAGSLLTIQNLTWGGSMGFQTKPTTPLFIPFHTNDDPESMAGAGIFGTWHEERGLTYFEAPGAGHFLTMDLPAVAYRSLEVLLGRVPDLQSQLPFSTDGNATTQPAVAAQLPGIAPSTEEGSASGLRGGIPLALSVIVAGIMLL